MQEGWVEFTQCGMENKTVIEGGTMGEEKRTRSGRKAEPESSIGGERGCTLGHFKSAFRWG
jgi:hypothetical protein